VTAAAVPGPVDDSWVVAVHASVDDWAPLGAGVLVDERRVLTCAHVVKGRSAADGVWVAFAKAEAGVGRCRVAEIVGVEGVPVQVADVVLLVLAQAAPEKATPAPLRNPAAVDLVGREWWAFGFPGGEPFGSVAHGQVGAALAYGWMRLDTASRYLVEQGYSGGGLWSPEYEAVVGLVGQARLAGAQAGDGRALTLRQIASWLPGQGLDELSRWSVWGAGEAALAAWGWTLGDDPEAVQHWGPRARGVSVDSERGYRFRGRTAALTTIVNWLDRPVPDGRVLAVTGSPGVGKSAVLGRVVTTADARLQAMLPADDDAVRASVASVACAVHARGKTALEVAKEIARAASVALPQRVEDLVPALQARLAERGHRFNVVIDALDEAASASQARILVSAVVLPLAQTCAACGAQVVVGTRRVDDAGDLLTTLHGAAIIDLDDEVYFAEEDLSAYVLATLQLVGDERPDNPYLDPVVASPVAARIAALAERNFLLGGLVARAHGLHDLDPVEPARLAFTPTVDAALGSYLDRLGSVGSVPARLALTVLAFAEAPGLTVELWRVALRALGASVTEEQLSRFTRSSAANFLIESSIDGLARRFRLFHQALSDALLREPDQQGLRTAEPLERRITEVLIAQGRGGMWAHADQYLLRSLPAHAARSGLLDDLLTDDEYLLYADLLRVTPLADQAISMAAQNRIRLLRLTPRAVSAGPAERAALLSMTAVLEGTGSRFAAWHPAPYRARWAAVAKRAEHTVLEGHAGGVRAVCPVKVHEQVMLASAGSDATVRLWDPVTGQQQRILQGHVGSVNAVCQLEMQGQTLLASAGEDTTVRLWDPVTGRQQHILQGHVGSVNAVCQLEALGQTVLASAGEDATVRLWDPVTGRQHRVLGGHVGSVNAVCQLEMQGQTLLASAGSDATVRLWDPVTGRQQHILEEDTDAVWAVGSVGLRGAVSLASAGIDRRVRLWDPVTGHQQPVLEGHTDLIRSVCTVEVQGRWLLVSASRDGTVRLWDPMTSQMQPVRDGHTGWVSAVCPVEVQGRTLLATASFDRTVRLWDSVSGHQQRVLRGHTDWIYGVCAVKVQRRVLLASASDDGTIRLWNPATGQQERVLLGHTGGVSAVCTVEVQGRVLLASASDDATVRLWNPITGRPFPRRTMRDTLAGRYPGCMNGHSGGVRSVCSVQVQGRSLLASAGIDQTVRLWDPVTGQQLRVLQGHEDWVWAVCPVEVQGRTLLASASVDRTVRLWDPVTGQQQNVLEGHADVVYAVCQIEVRGRPVLASSSKDRTIRLWDPVLGTLLITIPVYHQAIGSAMVADSVVAALSAGVLSVDVTL
jgi:WD40 repeat protein